MAAELLTVKDVATRAQVHPKTIRRAIAAGHLEAMQPTDGGGYRIKPEWYEAWVEKRRVSVRRRGRFPLPPTERAKPAAARTPGRLTVGPDMGRDRRRRR